MSTINANFQRAMYTYLDANLSEDVFDAVPTTDTPEEYVTIGDTQVGPFDTKVKFDNFEITATIHSWTRGAQGRLSVKTLMDKVLTLLQRQSFNITDYTVILSRCTNQTTVRDPDGVTYHGIQTFVILVNAT